jgi:hypothetical protein
MMLSTAIHAKDVRGGTIDTVAGCAFLPFGRGKIVPGVLHWANVHVTTDEYRNYLSAP